MKNQKTIFQICYVALTFLSLCHCSTKNLSTQKSRKAIHSAENISIQSSEQGFLQRSRIISISDSANLQYRVNIFPLDTFSFSFQNGFKGKASMIEVVGTGQQSKKITDSNTFRARRQNETQYDKKGSSKESTTSRQKKLQKKRSNLLSTMLALGISGLVIWMCWRLWKHIIRR